MHASELVPMSDREFRGFRDLVYRESGIHISEHKRELLTARLSRRIRTLGMMRFGEYLALVEREAAERIEMLDRLVTNETRFFREPAQFELLENQIVPRWIAEAAERARPRRVRVWSAGCSTGQEPYSIAMTLLARLEGWDIEVLATDISGRALRQAMAGVWPIEKAAEIPEALRKAFMLRGVRSYSGRMSAGEALRSVIRFQRLNLHEELPELGSFDLIFCRNVLIYFDVESRTKAVTRIVSRLAGGGGGASGFLGVPRGSSAHAAGGSSGFLGVPRGSSAHGADRANAEEPRNPEEPRNRASSAGYLFLGHSESLLRSGLRLRPVAPSVYTRMPR